MKQQKTLSYVQHISQLLCAEYKDSTLSQQYAWWLLEAITKKTKTQLITQDFLTLTEHEEETLQTWIRELTVDKKPIQYIIGSVPFNDLDILITPPTLIPRPETEEWCAHLIDQLKTLNNKNITILDLATGSGCIGLALAYHLPQASVIATDIAETALTLARKNSIHNNIHNIRFIQSDLFNNIPTQLSFDLIVTNPPYIAESERTVMEDTVLNWEDYNALFAPDNGLSLIKKIIIDAPAYIKHNDEMKRKNIPQLMIEIGHQQSAAVQQLMIDAGYNAVSVYKDLEKKDRVVVGRADYVANTTS